MSNVKNNNVREQSRMNFRLASEIKLRVARAATIVGQDLTEFAVSTLSQKADEILEKYNNVLLGSEDYQFFLNVLSAEDQNPPSDKSQKLADEYRRGTRKGARYHVAD